jgi:hypothetical protein
MLLGADPEFFLVNDKYEIVNAISILPYCKKKPLKEKNFSFFYDNILAELNFKPAKNAREFSSAIAEAMAFFCGKIDPYKISLQAYGEIDPKSMAGKNVNQVGCEADLNAYTFSYNKVPLNAFKKYGQRSSGGHIHIGGFSDEVVCDPFLKPIYVYMLDLFIALPFVMLANSVDEYKRRKIYGQAGCFRSKQYGIEYRTLSSFWIRSPETCSLVFDMVEFVNNFMEEGLHKKFWSTKEGKTGSYNKNSYDCFGYDYQEVRKAINECDINVAKKYYKFISNFMPDSLLVKFEKEFFTACSPFFHTWH